LNDEERNAIELYITDLVKALGAEASTNFAHMVAKALDAHPTQNEADDTLSLFNL